MILASTLNFGICFLSSNQDINRFLV